MAALELLKYIDILLWNISPIRPYKLDNLVDEKFDVVNFNWPKKYFVKNWQNCKKDVLVRVKRTVIFFHFWWGGRWVDFFVWFYTVGVCQPSYYMTAASGASLRWFQTPLAWRSRLCPGVWIKLPVRCMIFRINIFSCRMKMMPDL